MQTIHNWRDVLYIVLLALMLVSFQFLLQENIGLNLADEGYLWYGAVRTVRGNGQCVDPRPLTGYLPDARTLLQIPDSDGHVLAR